MKLLISLLLLLTVAQTYGQNLIIQGTVIESTTQSPIEFATVSLKSTGGDVLSGTVTDQRGAFRLQSDQYNVTLEISFLGFESKVMENLQFIEGIADAGIIALGEDAKMLDEVVVRAEKSTTEFKLDKRVFNVGQDLSSTGASALELLNNVPSVTVNVEGQIALRGSAGVQILVNGKPSVIASEQGNALGTLTADMIDRIEVITNPSAKYEAEGTSGIINIVLKKEEKKGINGSVSLNTGVPHNHSLGFSLNRRTEKWNLFSQAGVGYRELPNTVKSTNTNFLTGEIIESAGKEFRNEQFYNFILGTDYYINATNVITLSGSFAYEIEDQPSNRSFEFSQNNSVERIWERQEQTEATNPKLQYELQYKRDFPGDENHNLLFSAIGNFFGKNQSSEFINTASLGVLDITEQLTATNFQEGRYTFNLDYTRPFNEHYTLEIGSQYVLNDVSNDFRVEDLVNGSYLINDEQTNVFEYQQNVLGLYTTAAYEEGIWGLKLGIRMENTDLSTLLVNTSEDNNQNFTNIFPTAHTSLKVNDRLSLQAGYSKRIFRPRLWDLNPFFNVRNNFSVRTGNPDLLPEFTDSYEVGTIYILDKFSTNINVYYRLTEGVVERISTFENNVTTFKPFNLGTNKATGVEWNAKYTLTRNWSMNSDLNYNSFNREGAFEGTGFDFTADLWTARLTTKYKFSKAFEAELSGRYESDQQTIQGVISDNHSLDIGMRYKVMNGRGVLNFSMRDIFATSIREMVMEQEAFRAYSFNQRGRFITLGFSYGFGKGEAMEFSGRRRF